MIAMWLLLTAALAQPAPAPAPVEEMAVEETASPSAAEPAPEGPGPADTDTDAADTDAAEVTPRGEEAPAEEAPDEGPPAAGEGPPEREAPVERQPEGQGPSAGEGPPEGEAGEGQAPAEGEAPAEEGETVEGEAPDGEGAPAEAEPTTPAELPFVGPPAPPELLRQAPPAEEPAPVGPPAPAPEQPSQPDQRGPEPSAPTAPAEPPEGPAEPPEGPAEAPEGPAEPPGGPAEPPEGPAEPPEGPAAAPTQPPVQPAPTPSPPFVGPPVPAPREAEEGAGPILVLPPTTPGVSTADRLRDTLLPVLPMRGLRNGLLLLILALASWGVATLARRAREPLQVHGMLPGTLRVVETGARILVVFFGLGVVAAWLPANLAPGLPWVVVAGALAVGWSARDVLPDLVGWLFLSMEGTARPGQWIVVEGRRGRVHTVGMRATRLRDGAGVEMMVPNRLLIQAPVVGDESEWPVFEVRLRLDGAHGPATVRRAVREAALLSPWVAPGQPEVFRDGDDWVVRVALLDGAWADRLEGALTERVDEILSR